MDAITPPDKVKTSTSSSRPVCASSASELDPIITKLEGGDLQALAGVTSLPALAKIQKASTAINNKGYDIGSN